MKKIYLFVALIAFGISSQLNAQTLEGILSDGTQAAEGGISVMGAFDIDNEGLLLQGRFGTSLGTVFGGVGFYEEGVGTYLYGGLERAHKQFQPNEDLTLNGYYQLGLGYRTADFGSVDVNALTLRGSYLVSNKINEKFSAYTGLTLAFVMTTVESNILGVDASVDDNDLQLTLPLGATYNIDEEGKMKVLGEAGIGFSSGAGYFTLGFSYAL